MDCFSLKMAAGQAIIHDPGSSRRSVMATCRDFVRRVATIRPHIISSFVSGLRVLSATTLPDLAAYAARMAGDAKAASRLLAIAPGEQIDGWLRRSAELIRQRSAEL